MNKPNRADLLMGTALGKVISPKFADYLSVNGFYSAPASTKYHGNYAGGLFDHSYTVMQSLVKLTRNNNLVWKRPESPYIVGMFHDICKIDQYRHPKMAETLSGQKIHGDGWEYNPDTLFKGHGDKSLMLLSQHIVLTEEEALCIRYHMGAFVEKDEWRDYTAAIHKYPNVMWTHHADMLAAHVYSI